METPRLYVVRFIGSVIVDGFTRYTIEVYCPDGSCWDIQRRYSEIRALHEDLGPLYGDALPEMPARRFWGNQDPTFIMERQSGLEDYLNGVLQLECMALSPQSRQFLCKAGQKDAPDIGEGYNCGGSSEAPLPGMQLLREWLVPPASVTGAEIQAAQQARGSDAGPDWANTLVNTLSSVAENSNIAFGVDLLLGQPGYASVAGSEGAASAREDFAAACAGAGTVPPLSVVPRRPPPPPRVQDPFEAPATLHRIINYAGVQTSSRLSQSCHVAHTRLKPVLPTMRKAK